MSQPASGSPLGLWRERAPGMLRRSEIAAVGAAIANVSMTDEPHWRGARLGDAAAAVRLALTHDVRSRDRGRTDLIMSALLVCAVRGDSAARLVLRRQRIRMRRDRSR